MKLFTVSGEIGGVPHRTENVDRAAARKIGYSVAQIGAAMKAQANVVVVDFANAHRTRLASASAGKLAEYRIKEEIARDREAASEAELALISREAKARGTNRTGLLNDIGQQAAAYRQIALLIGALEAEAKAAIAEIPDDAADIETQIQTALEAKQAQIETAFAEAFELIKGGS
jgi:hypothetical protein